MKPLRVIVHFMCCLPVLVLAACAAETFTPQAPEATITPPPYPVAVSPTAVMAPTAYPAPATDTPAPMPTATSIAVPSPTETLQPMQKLTPLATAQIWEVWFDGFSCKDLFDCSPQPGIPYGIYSIMSDGSALKESALTALPPAQSPTSPDGSASLEVRDDGGLYSVIRVSGQAVLLHKIEKDADWPATSFGYGVYCWDADGTKIRFVVAGRWKYEPQPIVGYRVDRDGRNMQQLFVSDLKLAGGNGCSPDGQKAVVAMHAQDDRENWGLYVIDLNTGKWKQILSYFNVDTIRLPLDAVKR